MGVWTTAMGHVDIYILTHYNQSDSRNRGTLDGKMIAEMFTGQSGAQ